MSPDYTQEIAANLERAESSLQAARDLAGSAYFDFAASRAYYTAFYAATAALLWEGVEFSKHSGVIAAVHQRLVNTGKVPRQCGRDLNWLFELRTIGDYGETRHVPQKDAEQAIKAATGFLHGNQSADRKKLNKTRPPRLPKSPVPRPSPLCPASP